LVFLVVLEGLPDEPDTQGLRANIERFRNNPVMSDAVPDMFKPALYVGKREVPFPGPTRALAQVSQKSRSQ